MRRTTLVVAAAAAVLVIIIGSVYLVGPGLSSSSTGLSTSSAASSSSSSASSTTSSSQEVGRSSSTSTLGDWTTYQGDNARTGSQDVSNFTDVTDGWTSTNLDGPVYAQPLVYGADVFVATENNSVYALNSQSGGIVWRTNLGQPVNGDELQCGDIDPSGITGTPVIDPATGTLYVVSFGQEYLSHTLSAINASTGAILFQRAADPPNFVVTAQQQRSALSLANGMVYIPYGGLDGDCGQYYGWVVGLPANGTGKMVVYQVPTGREGGIWAPSGAAIDPQGNLYVATGNGASITTFDYGDSVIKLSSSLSVEGYFAPSNWSELNQNDVDLGSVGPSIVGPNLLFQIGKEGVGYLLNTTELGGVGGKNFTASVCEGSFGGTASADSKIFVPCVNGLVALQMADGGFKVAWRTSSFDAGPPLVTGGIVWTVDLENSTLLGFSVSTGHLVYTFPLGGSERFEGASAGDGQVFVSAGTQVRSLRLG